MLPLVLPLASVLGGGLSLAFAVGLGALSATTPKPPFLAAAAAAGGVLAFLGVSMAITPHVPRVRAALSSVAGMIAFAAAARLLPFSMMDDKPWPIRPIDVWEELMLLAGTYGAMFLAAFAVLRWRGSAGIVRKRIT